MYPQNTFLLSIFLYVYPDVGLTQWTLLLLLYYHLISCLRMFLSIYNNLVAVCTFLKILKLLVITYYSLIANRQVGSKYIG